MSPTSASIQSKKQSYAKQAPNASSLQQKMTDLRTKYLHSVRKSKD